VGEPTWAGCVIPADLLYDLEADVWVRIEGEEAVVGMTDVAQTRCGRIVQVTWKPRGRRIARRRPLCVIESAKWVGPVLSPLGGVLLEGNEEAFTADPAVANRDPYGAGWLVRLAVTDRAELADLSGGEAAYRHYRSLIDTDGIRCFRCEQ
jgi:glycine cleavage system H protein